MSREKPPSFYTGLGYLRAGNDRYGLLYEEVIELLNKPEEASTILDIGCGVGYFAERLLKRGYKDYIGLDFSQDMIDLASTLVPAYQYILMDVYDENFQSFVETFQWFIILETLEHISNDMEVLNKLPSGATIIGSVPSSYCDGHVRVYKGVHDVFNRYEGIIKFNFLKEIRINLIKKNNVLTIFRGIIK